MPGDLRDPEQFQPFHHDNLYDRTQSVTDITPDMDAYLQSIVTDAVGKRLDPARLDEVKRNLEDSGALHMHPGDETFRAEVRKLVMARRVASRWQN
jgi:hypothetical protein